MNRIFALCFAVFASAVLAQAPTAPMADDFLDRFTGQWVLEGAILGRPTTHDVKVEWVLDHQYLRIHEVSRGASSGPHSRYEAIVFVALDRANGGYTCLWLDTTNGDGLTIEALGRAKRVGDTIPFVFRNKDAQVSFTNTFEYDRAADAWKWNMDNVKDDKPLPFARLILRRAKA